MDPKSYIKNFRKGQITQTQLTTEVKNHYEAKRSDRNLELSDNSGFVHHHFGIGSLPRALNQISATGIAKVLNQLEQNQVNLLIKAIGKIKPSDKILDAGSGRGGTSFLIAKKTGASLVGVTISPYQAEFSRNLAITRFPNLRTKFLVMNMLNLNFPAKSFDHIFTNETTMYFIDLKVLFKEFARILKDRGRYILATWCVNDSLSRDLEWENRINSHYQALMNTRYEYLKALDKTGFKILTEQNLSKEAIPYWLLRKKWKSASGIENDYLEGYKSGRLIYVIISTTKR